MAANNPKHLYLVQFSYPNLLERVPQVMKLYKVGKGKATRPDEVQGHSPTKWPRVFTFRDQGHRENELHKCIRQYRWKWDAGNEWFTIDKNTTPFKMYEYCALQLDLSSSRSEFDIFHEGITKAGMVSCTEYHPETGILLKTSPQFISHKGCHQIQKASNQGVARFQTVQPIICDQPALEAPFEDNANTTKSCLLPPKKRYRQEMQNGSNCIIDTSYGVNTCSKQERDKLVVAELQRLFEFERVNAPEKDVPDVPGSRYYSSTANIHNRECKWSNYTFNYR